MLFVDSDNAMGAPSGDVDDAFNPRRGFVLRPTVEVAGPPALSRASFLNKNERAGIVAETWHLKLPRLRPVIGTTLFDIEGAYAGQVVFDTLLVRVPGRAEEVVAGQDVAAVVALHPGQPVGPGLAPDHHEEGRRPTLAALILEARVLAATLARSAPDATPPRSASDGRKLSSVFVWQKIP